MDVVMLQVDSAIIMFTPFFFAETQTPYNVSVVPCNPAGCGDSTTVTCFTQAGGGELV